MHKKVSFERAFLIEDSRRSGAVASKVAENLFDVVDCWKWKESSHCAKLLKASRSIPMPVKKPKKYSRLSLLGHTAKFPEHPKVATLETFQNENAKRDYWITFECGEFTSMCPVTGRPDFAKIRIEYVPDELCIETKSLKFYLASFRNTRAFNEAIVHAEFAPRGGIGVIVEAEFPERSDRLVETNRIKPTSRKHASS